MEWDGMDKPDGGERVRSRYRVRIGVTDAEGVGREDGIRMAGGVQEDTMGWGDDARFVSKVRSE
jgi:hypothetical protein